MGLPRGMKDIEAHEMSGIESVRAAFARTCTLFGYKQIEPSTMELLSTLEAKGGYAIRDEVYHFEDKGDRAVALRFDMTVGMARNMAEQKSVRLPARHAAFGGVWRYDEPQRGRYRYFHQWNIEVYGASGLDADAEVAEFTVRMLEALGIRGTIEISHRKIAEAHIRQVTGGDVTLDDMLRAVDKTQKKPEAEIISEYEERGHSREALEGVMRLAHAHGSAEEAEAALGSACIEGWNEMHAVMESLERRGVTNASVNLGIVRGLNYYSGIVFEAFGPDKEIGALAGGGRYDSLIEDFGGQHLPAVGAAGGVERTVLAIEELIDAPHPHVVVVHVGDEMVSEAAVLASRIRQDGIAATSSPEARALKRQMTAAEQDGARAVVIVAPREWAAKSVVIRDMKSRTEKTVPIAEMRAALDETLS